MHNLLEILIFTLRNFTKLPVLRYLGICNVLHIWHIRAIPTYRVYRLYDRGSSLLGTPTCYFLYSQNVYYESYKLKKDDSEIELKAPLDAQNDAWTTTKSLCMESNSPFYWTLFLPLNLFLICVHFYLTCKTNFIMSTRWDMCGYVRVDRLYTRPRTVKQNRVWNECKNCMVSIRHEHIIMTEHHYVDCDVICCLSHAHWTRWVC